MTQVGLSIFNTTLPISMNLFNGNTLGEPYLDEDYLCPKPINIDVTKCFDVFDKLINGPLTISKDLEYIPSSTGIRLNLNMATLDILKCTYSIYKFGYSQPVVLATNENGDMLAYKLWLTVVDSLYNFKRDNNLKIDVKFKVDSILGKFIIKVKTRPVHGVIIFVDKADKSDTTEYVNRYTSDEFLEKANLYYKGKLFIESLLIK